jgi:hypothetical protein
MRAALLSCLQGYTVGGSVTSGETAVWTEYKIQNVTVSMGIIPGFTLVPLSTQPCILPPYHRRLGSQPAGHVDS